MYKCLAKTASSKVKPYVHFLHAILKKIKSEILLDFFLRKTFTPQKLNLGL